MKKIILAVLLSASPAYAQTSASVPLDRPSVEKDFKVALEPGTRLHDRTVRLDSAGDFALSDAQCIVAVRHDKPTESVEVIHEEDGTKGYGVTQHTYVLARDCAKNAYFVMDVVVHNSQTTRDPIFGAFGAARQMHLVFQRRLSQAVGMSARCPASVVKTTNLLEALPGAFR